MSNHECEGGCDKCGNALDTGHRYYTERMADLRQAVRLLDDCCRHDVTCVCLLCGAPDIYGHEPTCHIAKLLAKGYAV